MLPRANARRERMLMTDGAVLLPCFGSARRPLLLGERRELSIRVAAERAPQ
jgi:hypothetical protein